MKKALQISVLTILLAVAMIFGFGESDNMIYFILSISCSNHFSDKNYNILGLCPVHIFTSFSLIEESKVLGISMCFIRNNISEGCK